MAPGLGVEMSQRPGTSSGNRTPREAAHQESCIDEEDVKLTGRRQPSMIIEATSSAEGDSNSARYEKGSLDITEDLNGEARPAAAAAEQDSDLDSSFKKDWSPQPGPARALPPSLREVDLSDTGNEIDRAADPNQEQRARARKKRAARLPWYAVFFGWERKGETVRSYMVHPESPFVAIVHYVQCMLLLYTGLAVPVVLAYLWDQIEVCWRNPMLEFDVFVDTFFLLEIPLNFGIGILIQGIYCDDPKKVAKRYIYERMGFDLLTSIPVSYLELWSLQGCGDADYEATGTPVSKLRLARLLKPLRLFRVLRVFRALKNLTVVTTTYTAIERFLRIHPLALRFLRVIISILAATHLGACTFWFVKVTSNDKPTMEAFLADHNLEPSGDIVKKYILSTYFVCTVFTTVGFGDLSGTNAEEQVLCIVLMLVGVMVFGVLLSEVEVGIDELKKMSREKDRTLQQLKNYLRFKEVSSKTERRILDWVGFQVGVSQMESLEQESREHLAPAMVAALDSQAFQHYMDNVPLLQFPKLTADEKAKMRAMLAHHAHTVTFQKGNVIVSDDVPAEGLIIIEEGHVRVEDDTGGLVQVLRHGQCIGEYSLIGEEETSLAWGIPVRYFAQTHVRCKFISTYDFDGVVDDFPTAREALVLKQQELMDEQEMIRRGSTHGRSYFIARARWISLVRSMLRRDARKAQKRLKKKRHSVDLNMFTQTVQGLTGSARMRRFTGRVDNLPFAGSNDKLVRQQSFNANNSGEDFPRQSSGVDSVPSVGQLPAGMRTPSGSTAATDADDMAAMASVVAAMTGKTPEALKAEARRQSMDEGGQRLSIENAHEEDEVEPTDQPEQELPRHPWSLRKMNGSGRGAGMGSFAMQHAVKTHHLGLAKQGSFGHHKPGHHHKRGHRGVGSHNDVMEAVHMSHGEGNHGADRQMLSKLSMKLERIETKMTHDMDQLKSDVSKILAALNLERQPSSGSDTPGMRPGGNHGSPFVAAMARNSNSPFAPPSRQTSGNSNRSDSSPYAGISRIQEH